MAKCLPNGKQLYFHKETKPITHKLKDQHQCDN